MIYLPFWKENKDISVSMSKSLVMAKHVGIKSQSNYYYANPQKFSFYGTRQPKGDVDAASPSSCVCLESSHEEFFVAISTIDFSNHNAPDFF